MTLIIPGTSKMNKHSRYMRAILPQKKTVLVISSLFQAALLFLVRRWLVNSRATSAYAVWGFQRSAKMTLDHETERKQLPLSNTWVASDRQTVTESQWKKNRTDISFLRALAKTWDRVIGCNPVGFVKRWKCRWDGVDKLRGVLHFCVLKYVLSSLFIILLQIE